MKSDPLWIKKSGTHLNGLEFSGGYDCAIYIDDPLEDVTIEYCDFAFCGYALLVNAAVKNLTFRFNRAYMLFGDGICINTTSGVSENLWLHDNTIHAPFSHETNRGFGISLRSVHNSYVIANQIKDSKWQGIHLENYCHNLWIHDNVIDGIIGKRYGDVNPWQSGWSGIWMIDSDNIWMVENTVKNTLTAGVHLEGGNNGVVLVADNKIMKPGSYGVWVENALPDPNIWIGAWYDYPANEIRYQSKEKILINGGKAGITINQ